MQQVPEAPFRDRKGQSYTWLDVQRILYARLRKRYAATVSDVILEDVAADVIVDLITYWQQRDSSSRDGFLVLEFAIFRGVRQARDYVHAYVRTNQREVLAGYTDLSAGDADEDWESQGFTVIDPDPTGDEVVEELDYTNRARRMLSELSDEDLKDWATNLLTSDSERAQAEREGVTQQSIHDRRTVRRTRARRLATKYGLV